MQLTLRYPGSSGLLRGPGGDHLRFAPNLSRPAVAFSGELRDPIPFREAMSALHEVVVADLRHPRRDRAGYEAWKEQRQRALQATEHSIRKNARDKALQQAILDLGMEPLPEGLEEDFLKAHHTYWTARRKWAAELLQTDPLLFHALIPCDPIVTVAEDVVYFEGFAKDESAWGCLVMDRDALLQQGDAALGTTNVDYSPALYDHFQSLRTYRSTRLHVDPEGFEVQTLGVDAWREEKIDLPPSWLRGYGQLQAAMTLPSTRVTLSPGLVYNLLTTLKRRREKTGPRSLRFHLTPGQPPRIDVLPWELQLHDPSAPAWDGPEPMTCQVWGRRRLLPLARLLPIADRFEVHLLGSGLPSVWIAHMGPLRFVLALSGWTTNSWTAAGGGVGLLAFTGDPDEALVRRAHLALRARGAATTAQLAAELQAPRGALQAALQTLASRGQLVYDFTAGLHRDRAVLDVPLTDDLLGPEPPELTAGRRLFLERLVSLESTAHPKPGLTTHKARVDGTRCEATFDADGAFARGRCTCSHHFRFKLRAGPCRHLLALRLATRAQENPFAQDATPGAWLH